MLLYPSMPLCEVIEENPAVIPVIGRFGIRLGVGEGSIREVAESHSVDPDFFVMVLNTFLNDSYFPENKLQTFEVNQIVDYLRKTNNYYLSLQLPNIEKHLRAFIYASRVTNDSLEILGNLFDSFRASLTERISRDEQVDFPAFISGTNFANQARHKEPDESVELLAEMKSLRIRFMTGDYEQNLCFGVIFALSTMQRDMAQNNRIRYRILYPMVENTANR